MIIGFEEKMVQEIYGKMGFFIKKYKIDKDLNIVEAFENLEAYVDTDKISTVTHNAEYPNHIELIAETIDDSRFEYIININRSTKKLKSNFDTYDNNNKEKFIKFNKVKGKDNVNSIRIEIDHYAYEYSEIEKEYITIKQDFNVGISEDCYMYIIFGTNKYVCPTIVISKEDIGETNKSNVVAPVNDPVNVIRIASDKNYMSEIKRISSYYEISHSFHKEVTKIEKYNEKLYYNYNNKDEVLLNNFSEFIKNSIYTNSFGISHDYKNNTYSYKGHEIKIFSNKFIEDKGYEIEDTTINEKYPNNTNLSNYLEKKIENHGKFFKLDMGSDYEDGEVYISEDSAITINMINENIMIINTNIYKDYKDKFDTESDFHITINDTSDDDNVIIDYIKAQDDCVTSYINNASKIQFRRDSIFYTIGANFNFVRTKDRGVLGVPII